MLMATQSFPYVAGDKVMLQFAVVDTVTLIPANITGDTIRMSVRRKVNNPVVLSTEDGTIVTEITNGPGGIFTARAAPADTQNLRGTYEWQCELEDALGGKTTIARGFLTFADDLAP